MNDKTVTITRATVWVGACALAIGFIVGSEWQAYRQRQAAAAAVATMQNALAGIGTGTMTQQQAAAGADVSGSTDHWLVTGSGNTQSATFELSGGNYATSWNTDCNDLVTMATIMSADYPMDVLSGSQGSTHEMGVPAGQYAVSMIVSSGCTWTVQIDAE